MNPSDTAAFRSGIHHAADMALVSALILELRDDADQGGSAAHDGSAEGQAKRGVTGRCEKDGAEDRLGLLTPCFNMLIIDVNSCLVERVVTRHRGIA